MGYALLKNHMSDERDAQNLCILLFTAYGRHKELVDTPLSSSNQNSSSLSSSSSTSTSSSAQLKPAQRSSSVTYPTTPIDLPYHFDATFRSFTKDELTTLFSQDRMYAEEAFLVPFDREISEFLYFLY